jgi:hypothetical protein
MPTITERTVDFFVDTLLFPARIPPRILTRVAATFAILLLFIILILTLPPIKDLVFCKFSIFRDVASTESNKIKNWCDFISVSCQIVLVIAIGGFVFTDGIARWIHQRSEMIQTHLLEITEAIHTEAGAQLTPRQDALSKCREQIDKAKQGINLKNFPTRIREISNIIDNMYKLLIPDAPPPVRFVLRHLAPVPFPLNYIPGFRNNRLIVLMSMRYGLAFPGRFYGGLAFLVFLVMVCSFALKTYFDYPATCS